MPSVYQLSNTAIIEQNAHLHTADACRIACVPGHFPLLTQPAQTGFVQAGGAQMDCGGSDQSAAASASEMPPAACGEGGWRGGAARQRAQQRRARTEAQCREVLRHVHCVLRTRVECDACLRLPRHLHGEWGEAGASRGTEAPTSSFRDSCEPGGSRRTRCTALR